MDKVQPASEESSTDAGFIMREKIVPLLVLAASCIVVLIALSLGETPEEYFREGTFVTYFSALQLCAVAVLALAIYLVKSGGFVGPTFRKSYLLWLLIAAGFACLAIDEMFEIHERADYFIHRILSIEETGWTDRLDDLIVLGYVVVGLGVILACRRELIGPDSSLRLLAVVFAFAFGSVVLDSLSNRPDFWPAVISDPGLAEHFHQGSRVTEEACKLFAEGSFILYMRARLISVRK